MTRKTRSDAGKPRGDVPPRKHVSVALAPENTNESLIVAALDAELTEAKESDSTANSKTALVNLVSKLSNGFAHEYFDQFKEKDE